ncbi:TRAX-like protein [Thysanoplusia orichalcea nucleopolyhedrovirus]|uniref:TRAX-like protein n=1 Tax=Thysanoplusia orichalcea nucleopolyhedrovirus TaxID=101850 RepID=L0CJP0_9ABAC|nr:TRAX-like protein [Thysanoplusia orichalcea nucleopolyhedrovirus]AGA16199.1 TRAX-like protein [Thysanoplusia orichalcea nucleopolyhedrovirus]
MMERTVARWHSVSDHVLLKIYEVTRRLDYYLQQYANLEMQIEEEIRCMEMDEEIDDAEDVDTIKNFLRNSMSTTEQRDLYALALKLNSLINK